jgi:hypothetical protein
MGNCEFNPKPDKAEANLRAARANRVFWADGKHIRPENTVMKKTKTTQSFVQDRESARTVFRPRKIATLQQRRV